MRYVALLRAVNVGGRIVKMDRLRTLFEQVKLRNIETFIASGNVIFESTASAESLEARIEAHLEKALGFTVTTMVRSTREVATVAAYSPFASHKPLPPLGGSYVGFLKSKPDAEGSAQVMAFADGVNDFHFHGREVYWNSRDRRSVLKLSGATFERALRVRATFRNVTTVRKLAKKYPV